MGKAWSSRLVGLSLSSVPGHSIAHPPEDATPFLVYWPALVDAARVPVTLRLQGEAIAIAPVAGTTTARAPIEEALPPAPAGRGCARRSAASSARARATRAATPTSASGAARPPPTPGSRASSPSTGCARSSPISAPFAIDRAMLPNLHAVNFTIRGILGDGVAASTRSDPQAKTLGEYVRARVVELPAELGA